MSPTSLLLLLRLLLFTFILLCNFCCEKAVNVARDFCPLLSTAGTASLLFPSCFQEYIYFAPNGEWFTI